MRDETMPPSSCFIPHPSSLIPSNMTPPRTIAWIGDTAGFVRLLDQTLLPTEVVYRDCRTVEEVWEAIKVLRVRGAPAIGIAAAMGVVVGLQIQSGPTNTVF